jgi:hypothetical protein
MADRLPGQESHREEDDEGFDRSFGLRPHPRRVFM